MEDVLLDTVGRLRATDNRLPFLAARAAVELKMFSDRKRADLPSVKRLSRLIINSNSVDLQGQTTPRPLMDPSTVSVFCQALVESQWRPQKPKTIEELAKLALELAKEMESQCKTTEPNGGLKRIMDFCVALARYSSSYRKDVLSPRRKHPYRK